MQIWYLLYQKGLPIKCIQLVIFYMIIVQKRIAIQDANWKAILLWCKQIRYNEKNNYRNKLNSVINSKWALRLNTKLYLENSEWGVGVLLSNTHLRHWSLVWWYGDGDGALTVIEDKIDSSKLHWFNRNEEIWPFPQNNTFQFYNVLIYKSPSSSKRRNIE